MSGNSTSLYSSSTSNITLSSNNLTTLYPGTSGTVTPAQPYGNANVVGLLAAGTDGSNTVANIVATGNITGNYFLGNGSQLTGITGTYSNANVATFLANFGSNTISTTGNITGGFILGNGSQLTGLPATYSNANVTSLLANFGSNAISTTGNVTAGYVVGNGSLLTNITGANVTGSVAQANQANTANAVAGANVSGQVANALVAGTVYTNAQPNITSLGTLSSVTVSGNITGGNLLTTGQVSATGNITTAGYFLGTFAGNISGNLTVPGANTQVLYNNQGNAGASAGFTFDQTSNVVTVSGNIVGGNISTTGNVTANYVIGNGSLLSNITGGNVTGSVAQANQANTANAVAGANVSGQVANALVAGTVYTNAQPNITSVGTLTSISTSGDITATGNITSGTGVFYGNGAGLTNINAGNIVGSYGNANVANFLGSYGSNTLSTTGNVTTGNLNVQLDAVITGNLTVNGNTTLVNSNVVTINDKFINVANNAATAAQANGGGLGVGPVGGEYATLTYNSTNNDWNTNIALSVNGNVTGSNFVGNGQYLSSITGANVTGSVAQANQANTANAVAGANVSGQVANALVAGTVYTNAQPNITSVGTLTSVAVTGNTTTGNMLTGGVVSATGNVTGNYLLGNGAFISGLPAGYSNADVATFLANFGSNSISTTGNVTAGNFIGNGSLLTSITGANVTGTVANATYAVSAGTAVTVTGNAQANITSVGTLTDVSVTGNATAGNILTGGIVSATGNVTGNYFVGNGSQLTGITSNAAGSNTQIQYNNGNAFAGNSLMTFDQTVGNVTLSNLIIGTNSVGNIAAGNAATRINTSNAFSGMSLATNGFEPGQIVIGNGFFGNLDIRNIQARPTAKFVVWDSANVVEAAGNSIRYQAGSFTTQISISNIVSNSSLVRGGLGSMAIGGGPSANSWTATNQGMGAVLAFNQFLAVGQPNTTAALGNVTLTGAAAALGQHFIYAGSNVGNAGGVLAQISAAGNVTTGIGMMPSFAGTPATTPTNTIGYYMPGTVNNYGSTNSNGFRAATNYYFLKNDDAVAQTQLGSLRSYNEYRYDTATSGSFTLDKNNAQVQYIAPTANVTITGYDNMVTSLSDSVNTDQEIDTLTVLVQQGATPYTVTLPTGATYQYAGNISTVPAVANSRSILTVVAANIAGTVNYFTTVTSDQATSVGAAGSNTQIQFNNAGTLAGNVALTFNNSNGNTGIGNLIIGSVGFGNAGSAQQINTIANNNGTLASATQFGNGQIIIGQGYFGNLFLNNLNAQVTKGAKMAVWDSATLTDGGNVGIRYSALSGAAQVMLGGNLQNNNTIMRSQAAVLSIGGSANNYSLGQSSSQGLSGIAGLGGTLFIGQPNATVALGNMTLGGGVGIVGQVITYAGSTTANAAGLFAQINSIGNTTTAMGVALQFIGATTTSPTNTFGLYNPNNTVSFGTNNANIMRAATNYYFTYNDDDVAQNKLGSLRAYHTYQAGGNSSGTWNIDKTNGQVQAVSATGNITIGSYTNFVTTASDSVNNDSQTDTVTLIIEQGATPYTVTMPTGNAAIKYANNVTTVSNVANTTTMVAITAYRTAANATGYLTTISPGFV